MIFFTSNQSLCIAFVTLCYLHIIYDAKNFSSFPELFFVKIQGGAIRNIRRGLTNGSLVMKTSIFIRILLEFLFCLEFWRLWLITSIITKASWSPRKHEVDEPPCEKNIVRRWWFGLVKWVGGESELYELRWSDWWMSRSLRCLQQGELPVETSSRREASCWDSFQDIGSFPSRAH